MSNRFGPPIVGLLFLSGMCALIFQISWLREFRLVFGGSTPASAAVLAIFMGGLGLGNAIFGKRADRHANPLRMYAMLEVGIALSAAASPLLIALARATYIGVGGQTVLGSFGATVVRLLLSALVLGIPTVLMGGTLPAAARAVTSAADTSRRNVAVLYGLNTLGAVFGASISTFYLLERYGNRNTLWMACGVNALIALSAFVLSIFAARRAHEETAAAPAEETGEAAAPARFVYFSAGVVGFAFFLMELVWFRMLGPILGGTTFTFGLILVVALAGIGLGGAAYAILYRGARPTLHGFALTCGLEAAAIAIPFALGDRIAVLAVILKDLGAYGFTGEVVGWLLITAIVILPAAFIAGVQFPMLIALLGSGDRDVGQQVGFAFACNTIGAIVGSLAGGFGLLPSLTAPGTWCAVVVVLSLLGLAALALASRRQPGLRGVVIPLAVVALALLCLRAEGPTAVWRHTPIGAGRAVFPSRTRNALRSWMYGIRRRVIWEAEGRELSLAATAYNGLSFVVNGKSDGNVVNDGSTQVMLGLTGAVLHPNPKRCLVVGLGTGESAGWLADVPEVEQVDVVELEPIIADFADFCAVANRDVLNNPKINLIINDAREVLLTTRQRYDLIASEPSNPYRAGVASLFTREFYKAVRGRLADDGIFLQWIQAYEIDASTVGTVMATLRTEFDYIEVWQTNPSDLLLVCSTKPIPHDVERLRARVKTEPFRSALLSVWRATDLEGFLARYVAGPEVVDEVQQREGTLINTDDHNHLEYGSARSVGRRSGFSIDKLREAAISRKVHRLPVDDPSAVSWARVEDQRIAMHFAREKQLPTVVQAEDEGQKDRLQAFARFRKGDMKGAIEAWNRQPRAPEYPTELAVLALAYSESGDEKALPLLEQLAEHDPIDAESIRAFLLLRQGKLDEAATAVETALNGLRENPWPVHVDHLFNLSVQLAKDDRGRAERMFAALDKPLAGYIFEELRRSTAARIAPGLGPEVTVSCIESYEPNVIWNPTFLQLRYEAYRETGHPLAEKAKRDLDTYKRQAPDDQVLETRTSGP